jgi:hypothetical protein
LVRTSILARNHHVASNLNKPSGLKSHPDDTRFDGGNGFSLRQLERCNLSSETRHLPGRLSGETATYRGTQLFSWNRTTTRRANQSIHDARGLSRVCQEDTHRRSPESRSTTGRSPK